MKLHDLSMENWNNKVFIPSRLHEKDEMGLIMENTDLDNLLALYKSWGINLTVEDNIDSEVDEYSYAVKIVAKQHAKIIGYFDFYTIYYFDSNKKFIMQAIWE